MESPSLEAFQEMHKCGTSGFCGEHSSVQLIIVLKILEAFSNLKDSMILWFNSEHWKWWCMGEKKQQSCAQLIPEINLVLYSETWKQGNMAE